jgi:predicted membrane-bound spermidine synthase
MPAPDASWRILVVGGGASALPRAALREHPNATVDVLERDPAVVELAQQHFDTDLVHGHDGRVRVMVGNLEDLVRTLVDAYDLVVFDSCALSPPGSAHGLSQSAWHAVASHLAPGAMVAWGPGATTEPDARWADLDGWRYAVYARTADTEGLVELGDGGSEVLRIGGSGLQAAALPEVVDDFRLVEGQDTAPASAREVEILSREEASAT